MSVHLDEYAELDPAAGSDLSRVFGCSQRDFAERPPFNGRWPPVYGRHWTPPCFADSGVSLRSAQQFCRLECEQQLQSACIHADCERYPALQHLRS